ncbi:MAG: type IV pili twitching motility protein PilT [Candidatus Ryanbacteria bacterium RIFCSPHIGHO2_02_FULL_48_12]|uniref:Type IV pili twitching motility protein PilT n=1 Tax=Candidatus Ryanbacteria bacterium RIFCSPHIGHO2_01_FULL_48_27 TaxID=1802115 RepID=A0A1G2G3U3_9BACT|nr:MAG: type IV pili twitching motility protein PilT [Candidatus Ryanbacteria bacterium RIFCSPHIGHO2_01_FULL_48_27]OGZ50697.1 MAG: type IV pili twitching motility protein PilT [Candidatus Ryanbacteria bacterium RIFCSPHIGHO2_02_FULL_48_12]
MDYTRELDELILNVARESASDLHITVGRHPTLRVSGQLIPLVDKPVLTPEMTEGLVFAMLTKEQRDEFVKQKELDFSYPFKDKLRFRVNAFYQRGFIGAALRLINVKIKTIEDLNLPLDLIEFARREQGFFLVVGPAGHGKSTTLASLVDMINHERSEHIVTVEDPVEYLFIQDRSIVDQREVRIDTHDFHGALRSMFREDVNVAMIGEMRDPETISAAVTAAETGHLVFSSLHTNSASQTIDRVIDSFPAAQQSQIRSQLASTLLGVFSQRLLPRVSGGLIPAYELMIANAAVRNLIRENKVHEVDLVIDTSYGEGMMSLNRSLLDLLRKGEITMETAMSYSLNPGEFKVLSRE